MRDSLDTAVEARNALDRAIYGDLWVDLSNQAKLGAPRATLTRYLQGFLAIRCLWTCYLRGVTALEGVSPARERRDPPPIPFFIGRNASATLTPTPPLLVLGKVAFSAESAVNSRVSRCGSGGPSRSLRLRVISMISNM